MEIDIFRKQITHNSKIYAYDDILSKLQILNDDIVYLAGSVIEGAVAECSAGMGNELSDIDVFIIRKHDDFETTTADYIYKTKKVYFVNAVLNGLDVEVLDYDYITQLATTIKSSAIRSSERTSTIFSSKMGDNNSFTEINAFLCRLKYSICIWNFDKYDELIKSFDFEHFSKICINHLVTKVDNIFPDIYGNLESCQYDVALYCMRDAFFYIMKIVLLNEGVFVDRPKWMPLKLRNLADLKHEYMNIWKAYVSLFRSDIMGDKACEAVVRNVLTNSKQEIERVLMGGVSLL